MGVPYQLCVRHKASCTDVALLFNQNLLEYKQHAGQAEELVGAIILGRVERVLPDIKAAFIKIGLPANGFLPIKEADSFHQATGRAPLLSGQDVLVQVKKAPKGEKGAFLSRDISLPGQYVLVMPCNRFVGLSKRIEEPADKMRCKQLGEMIAQNRFGIIVREAALHAAEEDVRNEAEELFLHWQEISSKAVCTKAPQLMYREPSFAAVLCRDYGVRHEMQVFSNDDSDSELSSNVQVISDGDMDLLWKRMRIDEQIHAALQRKVNLPDGGSLVIDEREALQTIDVNSGRVVKASKDGKLPLEENLRAIPEICRQIRLRNLSGILLVDFIDMDDDAERRQVQEAFEAEMADDRVKRVVHGFTRLGLLEMTRKRTSATLRDLLTKPCSHCNETGRIKTVE